MELSGEAILAVDDVRLERVEVPEWGGAVHVRTMLGEHRDLFEQDVQQFKREDDAAPIPNAKARLLVWTLCDAAGQLLFRPDQVEALGKKNAAALQRCFDVAVRLNGLDQQTVEALRKN